MTIRLTVLVVAGLLCLGFGNVATAATPNDCPVTVESGGQKYCFKDEQAKSKFYEGALNAYVKKHPP